MQHTGSLWLAGAMSHVRGTPHPLPPPTPPVAQVQVLNGTLCPCSSCRVDAYLCPWPWLAFGFLVFCITVCFVFGERVLLQEEMFQGGSDIRVWVTFVPGQPRKCLQPGRFSRTDLAVRFQASPEGSLAGGEFQNRVLSAPPKVTQDEWSWLVSVACDFWEQHWLAFSIRIYTWKWLTGALADICLLLGSVHH